MGRKQIRRAKAARRPATLADRFTELLKDEKRRPAAVRYLVPVGTALLSLLFGVLPMTVFRTAAGDSDPRSLFYWMHASFFGADGTKGALPSLLEASAGNLNLGFYRAVVVLYAVAVLCLLVGTAATVLTSASALYLLLTEEKDPQSHRVARIFRVTFGGRGMTLLPPLLLLAAFAYPYLLAYFYTVLLAYETAVVSPIDPLVFAVILFCADLLTFLWAKDKERRAKYDIFRSPAKRVSEEDKRDAETRAWEAAVRADAEGNAAQKTRTESPIPPKPPAVVPTEPPSEVPSESPAEVPRKRTPKDRPAVPPPQGDEDLFGQEFVLDGSDAKDTANPVGSAAEVPAVKPQKTDEPQNADETAALRETLRSLFDGGDGEEDAPKRKGKRRKR